MKIVSDEMMEWEGGKSKGSFISHIGFCKLVGHNVREPGPKGKN
jgi:hypothetical protein